MSRGPKATNQQLFNACPLHDIVTLAIDTARKSGWAITVRGKLVEFGECDVYSGEPMRVAALALKYAADAGLECVLVCEKPFKFTARSMGNAGSGTGMGAAFGAWMGAWCAAGGVKSRWRKVLPAVWRSRVLGKGWGSAKREVVQVEEQRVAQALVYPMPAEVGAESAPAILIGQWAARAPEIIKALPKSMQPKPAQVAA